MRVLGVDFGLKRIGLAVGETEGAIASPKGILAASGSLAKDAAKIIELAQKEGAEAIVIGLPLDELGQIGKQATICQKLALKIEELGWQVFCIDETLSTQESEQKLWEMGYKASQRARLRDAEAACRILERFFLKHEQGPT